VLITVDDAHRLDWPSADVLAFVARRIESDPILILIATRDRLPSPLATAGLREHRLVELDPPAAAQLLAISGPQLVPVQRIRVLGEAAGSPLALIELPLAIAGERSAPAERGLPLTERLERSFAARITELPEATRWLLLVAALDDQDHVDELLQAASIAVGAELDVRDLQPAADAAIVDLDLHTVRFRHPLMRSAVLQDAAIHQLRRAHEALAEALRSEPDRESEDNPTSVRMFLCPTIAAICSVSTFPRPNGSG
jgi:hypothetical protein